MQFETCAKLGLFSLSHLQNVSTESFSIRSTFLNWQRSIDFFKDNDITTDISRIVKMKSSMTKSLVSAFSSFDISRRIGKQLSPPKINSCWSKMSICAKRKYLFVPHVPRQITPLVYITKYLHSAVNILDI